MLSKTSGNVWFCKSEEFTVKRLKLRFVNLLFNKLNDVKLTIGGRGEIPLKHGCERKARVVIEVKIVPRESNKSRSSLVTEGTTISKSSVLSKTSGKVWFCKSEEFTEKRLTLRFVNLLFNKLNDVKLTIGRLIRPKETR